jgi:nucleotide-binding universal stress UspA family protein
MNQDVLVPMDRGEKSASALEFALEAYPAATVHVLHVTERNDPLGLFGGREPADYVVADCDVALDDVPMPDGNSFNRHQRERAEAVVERACRLADAHDREVEPEVRSGCAVEEVLACAEARSVDHIVVSAHSRTEIRPILRDVPEAIARWASRPVTVVP